MDVVAHALVALADGDRGAFDQVYEAVAPQVDRVCRALLGPGEDAEDAAQQALIRVFEQVGTYDPCRGSGLGWVLALASWEARTWRRRRGRGDARSSTQDPDGLAMVEAGVDDRIALVLSIAEPADRTVLLAVLTGDSDATIAPATFRKRVQRTITRMRELLSDTVVSSPTTTGRRNP